MATLFSKTDHFSKKIKARKDGTRSGLKTKPVEGACHRIIDVIFDRPMLDQETKGRKASVDARIAKKIERKLLDVPTSNNSASAPNCKFQQHC